MPLLIKFPGNEQPLFIELKGQPEYRITQNVIANFVTVDRQSARAFLSFFQTLDRSGAVFQAFQNLMILFEQSAKQTYYDSNNHLTIGIGLNLANPAAEAIICAVNKTFGTNYQYSDLSTGNDGKPSGGLSTDQINYMFDLTLVGTTESCGDASITFPGALNALIGRLATVSLDNRPFFANQQD